MDISPQSSSSSLRLDWDKASRQDYTNFSNLVAQSLPPFPPDIACCCSPNCSLHLSSIDLFADKIITCLLNCAFATIPSHLTSKQRGLAGWNDGPKKLRCETNFWHKVWLEAGCPKSGVLVEIKKKVKKRYKYAARKVKRQQKYLLRDKLAKSLTQKSPRDFWSLVNKLSKPGKSCFASVVDGVADGDDIADMWASKLKSLLNTHSSSSRHSLLQALHLSLSSDQLSTISVSIDDVLGAIHLINPLTLIVHFWATPIYTIYTKEQQRPFK